MLNKSPILIKKVRKRGGHGHHGGAWKIAYADFVTAMMAFFLLMWLIGSVNEEKKQGIANYFSPTIINMEVNNGSQGFLTGESSTGDMQSSGKGLGGVSQDTSEKEIFGTESAKVLDTEKTTEQIQENTHKLKVDPGAEKESPKENDSQQSEAHKLDKSAIILNQVNPSVFTHNTKKNSLLVKDAYNNAAAKMLDKGQSDLTNDNTLVSHSPEDKAGSSSDDDNMGVGKVKTERLENQEENADKVELTPEEVAQKFKQVNTLEKFEEKKLDDPQKKEQQVFKDLSSSFLKAIQENKDFREFVSHVVFEIRPEGLRIQLLDSDKRSMFPSGSAEAYDYSKRIIGTIAQMVTGIENKIVVSGHTDAHPFNTRNYTNWELSTDRANAVRRVMIGKGIKPERFESVMGKEATDPINKENPFAPENRRISITVLRDVPLSLDQLKDLESGNNG